MKILLLPLMLLGLTACGSQLRKPFCKNELTEIPAAMIGTYTVTMPKPDPATNNAMSFEQQTVEVRKEGVIFSGAEPSAKVWVQGQVLGGESLCMIDGQIYAQKVNENSTYTITKIEPTNYGLAFSEISFSVNDLKKNGIPFTVLPTLNISESADTHWSPNLIVGTQPVIVDNSQVPIEQLLKIGKRVSMYVTFNRVSTPVKGPKVYFSLKDMAVVKNFPNQSP